MVARLLRRGQSELGGEFCAVSDAELCEDAGELALHGLAGEEHGFGYLRVAGTGSCESRDFPLAVAQRVEP